jgi:glycosyltransferase involved in cell wall biosynthesis
VAVAPYPPLETFYFSPLKLTEYMASGVPVIASAIGPITAIIDHEETGLLVPPGDSAALVAALRRLHGDSALRDRLACAACDSVATQFTWDHVVERIFALAGLPAAPRQSELVGVGARLA